jgi:hypothetical protein
MTETIDLQRQGAREVGARNRDYKVVCKENADHCEFFNVARDPLEEFPLAKPDNCTAYKSGALKRTDPAWHFCRLNEVVRTKSFF